MSTIRDIAKIAGVSTSTVSHVVNRTRYVSPELVQRVEEAIKQLDELPVFIAKKQTISHNSLKEKLILFLISERNSEFQFQVEKALEDIVKKEG